MAVIILSLGIHFKLPLRIAFVPLRPSLEAALAGNTAQTFAGLKADIPSLFHTISAANTNSRLIRCREGGYNTNRILFILADDLESAFIYSPEGLDGLAYNSGDAGHLFGDWYWMKED